MLDLTLAAGRVSDPQLYEMLRKIGQQALKPNDLVGVSPITVTIPATAQGVPVKIGIDTTKLPGLIIPVPTSSGGTGSVGPWTTGSVFFVGNTGNFAQDNSKFFWDDGNLRLGLGTNAPSSNLHTKGSGNVYNLIESTNANLVAVATAFITGNRRWEVGQSPGIGDNGLTVYDATATAVRMYFDTAGKVGIGTNSPADRLTVHGGNINIDTAGNYLQFPDGSRQKWAADQFIYPESYGGAADAVFNNGGSMTSGSGTLTLVGGGTTFVAGDVGKTICVIGAGASGAVLKTTISGYTSSTQVTLTATASTSVYSAYVYWGTDNTTPISNALAASVSSTGGYKRVQLQHGAYLVTDELSTANTNIAIYGAGRDITWIYFAPTASAKSCFRFTGTNVCSTVSDISLLGPYASTQSYGLSYTAQSYYGNKIENVWIQGFDHCIRFTAAALSTEIDNIFLMDPGSYGISGTGSAGFGLVMNTGLIYTAQSPASVGVTNTSTTITAASPTFYQRLIGMRISIQGAGAAGADLVTTITAVASSTSATIAAAASTTATKSALIGPNTLGGYYTESGGFYMTDVDIVAGAKPLWLNPQNGYSINFVFLSGCSFDSANQDGCMVISGAAGGAVNSVFASNCWFASANAGGIGGTGQQCGVYIAASAATTKLLQFTGCQFNNNAKFGVFIQGGVDSANFTGCQFDGNSALTTATWDALYMTGSSHLNVTGCHFGHVYFTSGGKDLASIRVDNGLTGTLNINGNTFRHFNTANPVQNTSAIAGTSLNIANNVW